MSVYDDRLQDLRQRAHDASETAATIPDNLWPNRDVRERFEGILAYAGTVLEATDAALISDSVASQIDVALRQILDNPAAAAPNADLWASQVLDAVAEMPTARGREVEQAVKDAAANFQRSAQLRLNALNNEFQATQKSFDTFRAAVAQEGSDFVARATEIATALDADVTEKTATFEARFSELHSQAVDEQSALSRLRTTQSATFETAEEQRSAAARTALEEAESALRLTQDRLTREVEDRVAEIRRMESESAQLVGAIGLAGTAERYAEEVTEQKNEANRWRTWTVVLALLAVGGAVYALAENHPEAEAFAGKLTLSLILGGIATYAARQSAYHRQREQRARDLQLELTAFSPFIEPLSLEQQEEERVIMTRKTFGKTAVAQAAGEEPGPTALSFALRQRERAVVNDD